MEFGDDPEVLDIAVLLPASNDCGLLDVAAVAARSCRALRDANISW